MSPIRRRGAFPQNQSPAQESNLSSAAYRAAALATVLARDQYEASESDRARRACRARLTPR